MSGITTPSALEALLGDKIITNSGEEIKVASLQKSTKIVLLYFSAHWCPPCRQFTPKLSAAYAEYKKRLAEKNVNGEEEEEDAAELIFVSSDRDVNAFNAYHKEMSFPALPFDRRDLKNALSSKFHVQGIPFLVAMNLQGELVHQQDKDEDDGIDLRSLVMQHGGLAFPFTKSRLSQLEGEAKAKQEKALKALVEESSGFTVHVPQKNGENRALADLLAQNEFVSLLLGDGDFADPSYHQVEQTFKDTSAVPIYVGWKLFNEKSDHSQLVSRFNSFPPLSPEQKQILETVVGPQLVQHIPSIVTLRQGTGLCNLDGTCEEGGVPVIVSIDPMMRKVIGLGSSACPWDDKAVQIAVVAEMARLEELKKSIANFKILDGHSLISKAAAGEDTGNTYKVTTADEVAAAVGDDGVLGLYFSAHWCPPCRAFTPQLVKCYDRLKAGGKPFEVVFVSSDRSKEEFDGYFSSMVTESGRQWLALDYDERALKSDLSSIFDIEGIPTLVLLKKDGTILSTDGAEIVMKYGSESFPWKDVASS
jgi:nucleoredoxin